MPAFHRLKAELGRRAMAKLPVEKMIPQTVAGPGSSGETGRLAAKLKMTKALIVTDAILVKLGVVDAAVASLQASGVEAVVYDGVLPDPAISQVLAGANMYLDSGCDGIVAVGGGSSIDCAKVVGAYVRDPRPVTEFAGFMKVRKGVPPLIAIPTTHGTGSETTFAAVITEPSPTPGGLSRKFLINDFKFFPRYAILDPDLVMGLPQAVGAATGIDALTHAVESYLSPWATPQSLERSRSAVALIFGNILRVYHNGTTDVEARTAMLQASFDAGVAISSAAVGYVHAIAHTVGAKYHTPHGAANAMILPHVLECYGSAAHAKLAELARLVGLGAAGDSDAKLSKAFVQAIRDIEVEMNMDATVAGMRPGDVEAVATLALQEAHGERKSMIFEFPEFMKDPGYPCIAYLSHADVVGIVRKMVPKDQKAKL